MKKKSTLLQRKAFTLLSQCFCLSILLLIVNVSNGQIHLIKDLNLWTDPYVNDFNALHSVGENAFFHAKGVLYFTDGTSEGTVAVHTVDQISAAQEYNGSLYYTPGTGLWKSNGTPEGTFLLKDITPAFDYQFGDGHYAELNGILYFAAGNATHGIELWRTDGTEAGTYIVKDIKPGKASSNPKNLTKIGSKLFFAAPSGSNLGVELWVSDGTTAGTYVVSDINTGSSSSDPGNMIDVNGVCFFTAKDAAHGKELWRSDGTAAGTRMIKDIRPGTAGTVSKLAAINGIALFEAHDGVHGKELWRSDGTEEGTVMVKDIVPGSAGSTGIYVYDVGFSHNGIYYFIGPGNHTSRLWRSDGTAAGTYALVLDDDFTFLEPQMTVFNNEVYFFSQKDWSYTRLWKTDGTIAGTILVEPRIAYFNYGTYAQIEAGNSKLFMIAQEYNENTGSFSTTKIRVSDGTASGATDVFGYPAPTLGSNPSSFIPTAGGAFFISVEGDYHATYLYKTDGTTEGTIPLKKFQSLNGLQSFHHKAVFSAFETYDLGSQLWITDGTSTGTKKITPAGYSTISLHSSATLGSDLILSTNNPVNRVALWKTDGTQEGTILLKEYSGYTYYPPTHLTSFNNKVVFGAAEAEGSAEYEPWVTDGTPAGTYMLADLRAGGGSFPNDFRQVGNVLTFIAYDGAGAELYRTDGTPSGTFLLKDFSSGQNTFGDFELVSDDKLVFSVAPNTYNRALWTTDGTVEGTLPLKSFSPAPDHIKIVGRLGNELIILVTHGVSTAVWKTDGTTEGTVIVKELGTLMSSPNGATILDGVLYLSHPLETGGLWRTDGTECGTYQILHPGDITAGEMITVGSKIILNARLFEQPGVSEHGDELYGYTPEPPLPCTTLAARTAQSPEEDMEGELVKAYPNPFRGEISVEFLGNQERKYAMEVLSLNGRKIQSAADLSFNTSYRFGGQWAQGVYLLKATIDGKVVTRKVVKIN